jgi:Protein of unknown function (DUF4238)
MAKSHKAQHWIPKSYLQAWTDPNRPPRHEPFVHVFEKDGGNHRKRAPSNIFTETDLYTIKRPDGSRDLRLEHGLSQLETTFSIIRRDFLSKRRQVPSARWLKLMAFVAALHSRTPVIRDHHMRFWTEVLDKGERLERRMKTASVEQKIRAAASVAPGDDRGSMTLDDVRRITASPMEHTLGFYVAAELPLLPLMRAIILCTNSGPGFITSDSPVVWFNPEWYKNPPIFRSPCFSDPLLEISLPISPEQMLVLTHPDPDNPPHGIQYLDVFERHVTELNRRTRFECHKEFVVRRNLTEPRWFDRGTMPSDSWEAQHGMADPIAAE